MILHAGLMAGLCSVLASAPPTPSVETPRTNSSTDAPPPPPRDPLPDVAHDEESSEATEPPPASGTPDTPSNRTTSEPSAPLPSPPKPSPTTAPGEAPILYAPEVPPQETLPIATEAQMQAAESSLPYTDPPEAEASLPVADVPGEAPPNEATLARENPLNAPTSTTNGRQRTGSAQRFAFELKFGPYLPDVDADYPGTGYGPYAQIFGRTNADTGLARGEPRPHIMPVLGLEWQFLHLAGPLSVGTTIGLFRDRAYALYADGTGSTNRADSDEPTYRSTADRVRFNLVPITLLAGYRFELLADRYRIPLVPYARGGLAYGFWWSLDGSGNLDRDDRGIAGRGGSLGWQANLGGMLRLDFIEPDAATELDRASGINHTYFFGEYQISRIGGLGSRQALNVGHDTWMLGLAVEF